MACKKCKDITLYPDEKCPECKKCKCKEPRFEYIHDIHTFQVADMEVYLGGVDNQGEDVTLVFPADEILTWIDIRYIREKVIEHYGTINREEAENLKESKQTKK